jgi:tetratricopeptide (TPR) repeat protein
MDPVRDLLARLGQTQGDTYAQAALTAEFLLMTRPEEEQEPLRSALDAAAVLRWFNANLVAQLLLIPNTEAEIRFHSLKSLSFVEPYEARNETTCVIQRQCRLGWRKQLAHQEPDRFRMLSARAADCLAGDQTNGGRIECIYHLLCGDPDRGAAELERLEREWSASARQDESDALAKVLQELEDTRLVNGRARARCLLAIAWSHYARGEVTKLNEIAADVLQLAQKCGDKSAEADARRVEGDALQRRGKLGEAQVAYNEHLAIYHHLADNHPSDAGWQRALAVAYSKVGDILQAQGKLAEAQVAFEKDLSIGRRLAERDPDNANWQWDLAAAYSKVGDVLQAQGQPAEAQPFFEEYLAMSRRLVSEYPRNAGFRHDLVVAESRMCDILQAQKKLAVALLAVAAALENSRQLVEQDANNTAWQRDLARIHWQAAGLLFSCGFPEDAKEYQSRAVQIRQLVALREPGDARSQREVLSALGSFFPPDERYGRFLFKDLIESQVNSVVGNLGKPRPGNRASSFVVGGPPASLFICYSSKDIEWRTLLEPTLRALKQDGYIYTWYDRMVDAGKDWNQEIQDHLDNAEIILCLVSTDFRVAPYIQENELPKALERQRIGKARVVPLVVRSCNFETTDLYPFQTATGDTRPLKDWVDSDVACARIELQLRNVFREIRGLPKVEIPPL